MKSEVSAAFERISPLCSQLVRSNNAADIVMLQGALRELDKDTLQMLQEYVIFPFRLILKKETPEDLRIQCLDCLTFIFDNTRVTTLDLFGDLIVQLFKFVSSRDISEVSEASEELKCAVCKCVASLVLSSSIEIHRFMYSLEYCPFLGHSLFVLLGFLKQEKSKSLRLSVMRTISALIYCSSDYRFCRDETVSVIAGDRLAAFLPGIANGLWVVLCGDPKQGHVITVTALRVWTEFITLTLADRCIKDTGDAEQVTGSSQSPNSPPCVVRNNSWVKKTSEKIEIQVKCMTKLVCHDHWKVRREFASCAKDVLLKCTNSLQNCVSFLLNSIFALSVDTYDEVSSVGKEATGTFACHVEKMELKPILLIAEDEVLILSSQLIKSHLSGDDSRILSILRSLNGYLQMLGSSVGNILRSPPHLSRLLLSLLHITELDCSEVNLLAESSVSLDLSPDGVARLWPKKSFKYFQDPEVVLRISSICQLLGCCADVRLLVDYLIEKFIKCDEYRKQAVLLISLIVKGITFKEKPTSDAKEVVPHSDVQSPSEICYVSDLIGDILEEFLSSKYWILEKHANATNNQTSDAINKPIGSFTEMNSLVIQVCLLLEAVATFSSVLGSNFRPLLLGVLCPVMEKAGNSNLVVSQAGKTALNIIASSCEFKSVEELIVQNSDYLVNSVTINLQQYIHRPETGVVLRVVLDHCNIEILTLFRDPIYKLLSILDYNVEVRQSVLHVLNSVVVAVKKVSIQKLCGATEELKHADLATNAVQSECLRNAVLEYHNIKQSEDSVDTLADDLPHNITENDFAEDSASEDESKNSDLGSQETSGKPFHVEVIVKILERCIHLQSSSNITLCLLSLDTIASGVEALSDFPDELLPVVHKIWNPLVLRFGHELVVSMRAFKTLVVIGNKCGDFVRSRTLKDVWPHLLSFLERQETVSMGKGDSSPYRFTQAFKYQQLLLSEIGHLARLLDLNEKEVESIVFTCVSYLGKDQPVLLQKAAHKAVQDITCLASDAMWFYLKEAFSNTKYVAPPHFTLEAVHFSGYANSHYPEGLQL